jgi:hypothetical protein
VKNVHAGTQTIVRRGARFARLRAVLALAGAAAGLAAGRAAESASAHPEWRNLAAGREIQFGTPPNYPAVTDPEDARQLTDGLLGTATPMWYGTDAVGWVAVDPVVVTVDLGAVQPIRGMALHVPGGQAGVEWPESIHVYVSDTGEKFSFAGDLMELHGRPLPGPGYAELWLVADRLETHGRFVRFVCSPRNLGNGAYIFLGEIEVYEGDPAWLTRPLVAANAPKQWLAAWPGIAWQERPDTIPEAERPRRLVLVDAPRTEGGEAPAQRAEVGTGGMHFALTGEAGVVRSMAWTGKLSEAVNTEVCRYALLSFRSEGIRRTFEPRPVVALQGVNEGSASSEVTLLEANLAPNDARNHTLIKPLPPGFTLRQIRVWLSSEHDTPFLVLERLELVDALPDLLSQEIARAQAPAAGWVAVPLDRWLNGSLTEWFDRVLAAHGTVLDGARVLPEGPVTVSGVPFAMASGERNLALMPETQESDEEIDFLGARVKRRFAGPISRDDALGIEVDAVAREAFLLLALAAPPIQKRGGLPPRSLCLDDIESISVELAYDRGEAEFAFPYSLADQGCCVPARQLGAYAVAVDTARRLKRVTLHNHHFGPSFALVGLTLNTSATALVPALADTSAPESTAQHPEPRARPVSVTHRGNRLTLSNRWYELGFDLAQGFCLDRLVHRSSPGTEVRLSPTSGLRVRVGDALYTGQSFTTAVVRVGRWGAELLLSSRRPELPLEIAVGLRADESPELVFTAQTTNRGEAPLAAEVCLPAIAGLALGELASTRLFFPQYRAVDTGERMALRAPYGPEFTAQFMAVYSRREGIGLMLRSDNPEQRMATFALGKDALGVSGGIGFPAEYNRLAPGSSRSYPPVSLVAHTGDWHAAFALYRDWVRSWYRPHRAQDKGYFLDAWEMTCYRPSAKVSWADSRVPPIITADRQRFLLEETFAFEQQYLGHVPDLVHFFNWTYNDQKQRNEYGVYGTELAYAQVGGLEFFRQGIAEIQSRWQRPVSLYTLSDRFRASALPDQALSKELAANSVYQELDSDASEALRAAGSADGIFYPRFGHPKWVEFFVNDIARMQRETGCRIVYMDVFPYFSHLRGHDGLSPREGDLLVVRRMRDALPADVALWTEYGFTDVASQYADGSVHYYFLDLNEVFARRYSRPDRPEGLFTELPLNLQRYVLPRYRAFALPVYIEGGSKPSQVDAVFVNGEPFHEDTWRLHHTRLREKLNRAYVVKREYADCFGCADPVPQVETAVAGIVANRFPGTNRTLWTLYNGRPRTWSGVVLAVPHRQGATYRDVWNDQPLSPVVRIGLASIALTLHPQQPGCVVQEGGSNCPDASRGGRASRPPCPSPFCVPVPLPGP